MWRACNFAGVLLPAEDDVVTLRRRKGAAQRNSALTVPRNTICEVHSGSWKGHRPSTHMGPHGLGKFLNLRCFLDRLSG